MRSKDKFLKIFYLILFLAFLIFINNTNLQTNIRVWFLDASQKFLATTHFLFFHFSGGLEKIGELVDVYREKEKLNQEVSELKLKLIRYEEAKIENERLRALLQFQSKNQLEGKSAQIIGRDLQAISDVVIINQGKKDGVDVGTVLISHEGLVGHVIIAGENHAKALLITDVKTRVSAVSQETRDVGIIEGTPTHLLKFKNVNMNATLKIGDIVITSGFGDIFPKGIPIGRVEMIGTEQDNLYLYALVKPFVNFSKLEEVLCLETNK